MLSGPTGSKLQCDDAPRWFQCSLKFEKPWHGESKLWSLNNNNDNSAQCVQYSQVSYIITNTFNREGNKAMRSNLSKVRKLMQAYLVLLCFTLLRFRYCLFLHMEAFWQLCFEHIYWCHFPTVFAHFMSLCHILVILAIFQTLHQQKGYYLLIVQMMVSIFSSIKYF